jgi:tetratricopeptide (TPR) repeat protein
MFAERGERLNEAERLVARALEREPANAAFLDSMGWVLFRKGDAAAARVPLERAASSSRDPIVFEHLGDCLDALGEPAAALERYEQARELGGGGAALQDKIDRARKALGERQEPPSEGRVLEGEETTP